MAQNNSGSSKGTFLWVILFVAIAFAMAYWRGARQGRNNNHNNRKQPSEQNDRNQQDNIAPNTNTNTTNLNYLPVGNGNEVVQHIGYTLSYSEQYEQAEWVAYVLTKDMFVGGQAKRNDNFRPDGAVKTRSATPDDYRGSGYDRGHMCPASDMSYDERAMDETFLMSNMSPQVRNFNGGIWRELEENVKDWARKHQKIYVVTGPILKPGLRFIGKANKVSIPEAYYKVILDANLKESIAYIMPNEVSEKPINDYVTTIDEVEKRTNINFFPKLLTPAQETSLESKYDTNYWPISEKRYQIRLREWNRR